MTPHSNSDETPSQLTELTQLTRRTRAARQSRIALLRRKLGIGTGPINASAEPRSLAGLAQEEGFLRYLLTIESEPTSTFAKQLIALGIELPPPDSLSGKALQAKLGEVIGGLAKRRVFLYHTNHLTDAELYAHLWNHLLNEPAHELDPDMGDCGCHVDLLGDGSLEAELLYFRFHATEEERLEHRFMHPDAVLPERATPPSNRDEDLPRRDGESGGSVIMIP